MSLLQGASISLTQSCFMKNVFFFHESTDTYIKTFSFGFVVLPQNKSMSRHSFTSTHFSIDPLHRHNLLTISHALSSQFHTPRLSKLKFHIWEHIGVYIYLEALSRLHSHSLYRWILD